MHIIKQSSEAEMIFEFMKMEMSSDRHSDRLNQVLNELNISTDIIFNGDINSKHENTLRAEVMNRFRGYPDEDLFERFPTGINWVWTLFDREDLYNILYIEYSYWNELSNYTGSPLEAAKTILSGRIIYDVPNDSAINGARLLKIGHKFLPMIFLTDVNESRFIILEGHGRMTAYGLVPDLFREVSVLLGYCGTAELSKWYGEMPARPE